MDYSSKASSYFANVRTDLTRLIGAEKKKIKVLEVGAAYGETLFYLKQSGVAAEAVGVDIFEDTNNPQNYKAVDRFIFGNIDVLDFPEYTNYFDLIMLPDVLEHVFEPGRILQKLKTYLKDDGEMIISMPNIRHYSALNKIFLKGNFQYEESGIFDYTHMRFYCREDMRSLFESNGFQVVSYESSIKNYKGKSTAKIINTITLGLFEQFFSYQYFFIVRK
ncbi:hypothetical protein FNO01nite_07060 [Flavobacterium noncentrifugens]|uniref:Ubiquinone/menaquinone biosynthesis C-methylase UbiE n=1 Tax=Flavobacterium noncentrifugens TaxID=1128970 RepID=A0A1G8SZZ2_9FLAO|nr:class I SAM-dependent methyltransferase [Flavobacterium noncentrifugens]GEP50034.1 hypothetical protein FNO01nite_07060 [Flavobacterium noncentrifugens]SDJ34839.1 Ubiquinone/menaquinone biosynthesis C-methylase UbiE [Flavobacterium noncentrifugens]